MKKISFLQFGRLSCAFALCLIFSIAAFAQSDSGTITGFVRDQTGGVVPNAKVTVKSESTGESHSVSTDAAGHYTVTNLLPGLYEMTAESSGFKKFDTTHNQLQPNSTIAIDADLAVGQTTETVEVSATAEVLQTESGAVQSEVTGAQIQNQELNGRSPIYSAQFLPGVRSNATLGDKQGLGPAGQPFSINGARSWDTMVSVDGAPALRTRSNGAVIGVGSVDATQEIQVLTADYQAEYGRAAGGQIRIVTKGGTTEFHGSAYEYFQNSDMNANTWSRNLSTSTNFASPYRYNNFGFAVGGPGAIPGKFEKLRQKFFWFVSEEWLRQRSTDTQQQAVPTALMRQGNFSELLGSNPWYKTVTQLYFPGTCPKLGAATCAPIPGNIIPKSSLSPNGLAILDAYPVANFGPVGTNNWISQAAHPYNQRKENLNFDILPNDKNHIEFRKSDLAYFEYQPFDQGSGLTPKYFNRPNQSNTLSWIYTITPTLVNEARATVSLDDVYIPVNTAAPGFNAQTLGINFPYLFPAKDVAAKIPSISLNDNFYSLAGGPYPSHSSGPIYTFSDSVSKVWGNHTLKFGFLFDYDGENDGDQINVNTVPGGANNQNGNFTFTDAGAGIATSGASIANLALGYADSYTEIGPRAYTIWRGSMFEEFAQDSWKVTPKLHIDYGVRITTMTGYHPLWGNSDYFNGGLYNPTQAVTLNSAGNVVLGTGNPYNGMVIPGFSAFPSSATGRVLAATSNICDGASCNSLFAPNLSKSYISNSNPVQPRLGIAYQIDQKTVIRAGAGEFSTRMPLLDNIFPGGNSPFQPFVTVNNVRVDNPAASLTAGTAAALTVTTLNPKLKQPIAWNYNFTFQRELFWSSTLSVGYVGHRGYHGWDVYDINQAPVGALQANPGVNINLLRPYKGYSAIQEEESVVNSMYNGLQVSWSRRFTAGSMFGFTYTFSKSSDNSSNYRDIVPDTYNTSNLWGPSEYDARHMAVINYLYALPFFKDQTRLTGKLLGGWQLSGIVQFQTGSPCGIGTNTDYAGVSSNDLGSFGCGSTTNTEGQFWVLNGTPQITGGFAGGSGSAKYFTANATPPAAGTFNLQQGVRDSVYGPGFQDWNLMLFKKFAINERNAFEFRAEAYDFINHPNWATFAQAGGPNVTPNSSAFGEVTQKSTLARNLQLSLRYSF